MTRNGKRILETFANRTRRTHMTDEVIKDKEAIIRVIQILARKIVKEGGGDVKFIKENK